MKSGSGSTSTNIKGIKKFTALAITLWCLAITASLLVNHWQREEHLHEIGLTIARSSFEKDILYRRWNASHGGVYARQSSTTIPNPYLEVNERDISTPGGVPLTLINPAYMTRQAHEMGASINGVQGHITSLDPIRPQNAADPWEKKALESFEKGDAEFSSFETYRGETYLRYMKPLITEKGCIRCHEKQGYKVGEIRGGLSQSVPLSLIKSTAEGELLPLWSGHLGLWILGLLFIMKSYRIVTDKTLELESSHAEVLEAHNDLKMSQSKLLQSEKMASIGQLAAGVAHEINNPLGFIIQNLKSLDKYSKRLTEFIDAQKKAIQSHDSDSFEELKAREKELKIDYLREDIPELIEESLDGADRVQTIVKNLKTFSRVDQDAHQESDINECIESTISIIWNELKYKVELEKDFGELPLLKCYPQQLSQVFMNLLINASHAIDTKGTISITTRADDGDIIVKIRDNGSGISEENLKRIFEPFFTTKDVGKGTGLGLSMVFDIVKNHKGEISVDSTVGEGTEFLIRFPVQS